MKEVELRKKIVYEIKARKTNAVTNKKAVYRKQQFLPDIVVYRTVIILYSRTGLWLLWGAYTT